MTAFTTCRGQSSGRDIGVGQNWLSSKFQAVKALQVPGPHINSHHQELYKRLGGPGCMREWIQNTRRAIFEEASRGG
jgi:hypothetical protein